MSTGEPQSRSASTPAARSVSACSRAAARSSTGVPPVAMPTWQCASTRPGSSQPPRLTVSAPGTGSVVIRPSRTHRSRCSPSGSTTPERWQRGRHRPGCPPLNWSKLSLRQVGQRLAGRQRPGTPPGMPGRPPGSCPGARRAPRRDADRPAGGAALGLPAALALLALLGLRLHLPAAGLLRHRAHAGQAHAAGHLAHHLLGLGEPLQQLVDVGDADARSRWRCAPAATR